MYRDLSPCGRCLHLHYNHSRKRISLAPLLSWASGNSQKAGSSPDTSNAQKRKLTVASSSPPICPLQPLLCKQITPFDLKSAGQLFPGWSSPRRHLYSLASYCDDYCAVLQLFLLYRVSFPILSSFTAQRPLWISPGTCRAMRALWGLEETSADFDWLGTSCK